MKLVASDYAQIEVRIAAAVSRDPDMMKIMQADPNTFEGDFHAQNIARIFGVPYDQQKEVRNKPLRTRAKNSGFGALYGSKGYEVWAVLAKQFLSDPELDGQPVPSVGQVMNDIKEMRRRYPKFFDEWVPFAVWKARENENTSKTLYGRPRIIPDLTSRDKQLREAAERECVNHIVQGTAADVLRLATVRVARIPNGRLILSVHDELVARVDDEYSTCYAGCMNEAMLLEQPLKDVPLVVTTLIGDNWYETHG